MRDLNYKRKLFIEAYLGEAKGNATEAARIAGYKQPHTQGPRLLKNVEISARVSKRVSDAAMTADEVLRRLTEHARGDAGDFLDVNDRGVTINLAKARDAGKLRLIKKFGYNKKQGTPEFELYDAQAALGQLGRYHKLFTDKVEHDFSKLSDAELIEQAKSLLAGIGEAQS